MSPFQIETHGADLLVRLAGEITIEQAGALHTALLAAFSSGTPLHIDARDVSRLDAAAIQVLLAAARSAPSVKVVETSGGWVHAFQRFGLAELVPVPLPVAIS